MTKTSAKAKETAEKVTGTASEMAFELPASIRGMAEKSLDQSREAYGKFKGAAEEAANLMEDQAQLVAESTTAINHKALDFAESNIKSTFDFARKLLATKDLNEAVELQLAFGRKQVETFGAQAKELSDITRKTAEDVAKPYNAQMEKSMSEFKTVLPS